MANLREPYAATALASLEWSETQEKAVDRVAASGRCANIGVALWKAKYMLEATSLCSAHTMLCYVYRTRYPSDPAQWASACAKQALLEYIATQCRVCHGVGELVRDDLRVVCGECSGTALHRYSDDERAALMGREVRARDEKLRWLLGVISAEDGQVNARLNIELERGDGW
jgi:hypothetical protein